MSALDCFLSEVSRYELGCGGDYRLVDCVVRRFPVEAFSVLQRVCLELGYEVVVARFGGGSADT